MVNVDGPKGPGWVIELKGHHFYNPSDPAKRRLGGSKHVLDTLIHNLEHGSVEVPLGPNQPPARFTMKELGIGFVILARDPPIRPNFIIPNPNYIQPLNPQGSSFGISETGSMPGMAAGTAKLDPENPEYFTVSRYDFIVQFCWVETPLNVRIANQKKAELEKAKAAEAAAAAAATATPAAAPAQPDPVAPAASPPGVVPPQGAQPGPLQPGAVQPGGNPAPAPAGAAGTEPALTVPATPPATGPAAPIPPGQQPAGAQPPPVPDAAGQPSAAPATPTAPPAVPDAAPAPVVAPQVPDGPM